MKKTIEVNITHRQVGKTSKCIELLKENPNALMVVPNNMIIRHILKYHPYLDGRIITYADIIIHNHQFLYGFESKNQLILDDIASIDTEDIVKLGDKLGYSYFENINDITIYTTLNDREYIGLLYSYIGIKFDSFQVNKITSSEFISKQNQFEEKQQKIKEVTIPELEEHFGCKVKVIK